jgi:hypothetical protein
MQATKRKANRRRHAVGSIDFDNPYGDRTHARPKSIVQQAIQSGHFARPEAAVEEALSQWEERERQRAELLVDLDEARASVAQGKGRLIGTEEQSRQLADDIKQRGLALKYRPAQ